MAVKIVIAAVIGMLLVALTGCSLPECFHADTNRDCAIYRDWGFA